MPPARFEPAISESESLHSHVSDSAVSWTGMLGEMLREIVKNNVKVGEMFNEDVLFLNCPTFSDDYG